MPYYAAAAGIFLGFSLRRDAIGARSWSSAALLGTFSLGALVWMLMFSAAKPARSLPSTRTTPPS